MAIKMSIPALGLPFILVIIIQFLMSGLDLISKAALNGGMSVYVLSVYRHAVATVVMAPFAFYFDRPQPRLTKTIFLKILLLGILEPVMGQILYFLGMKNTSATFTAALTNVLPALTFVVAVICRVEKINITSMRSWAKVGGTLATVGGAMIMTFVKGPVFHLFSTGDGIFQGSSNVDKHHTMMGALLICGGCLSWACFMVLQGNATKAYPADLSLTVWICFVGTVEGAVVALIAERRNTAAWKLKWDMELLAVFYNATIFRGILCSGIAYYLQSVIMRARGAVFVTAFSPLKLIIVAIFGSLFLGENLNVGKVIGAFIITGGLYLIVWGKSKEVRTESLPEDQGTRTQSSAHEQEPVIIELEMQRPINSDGLVSDI